MKYFFKLTKMIDTIILKINLFEQVQLYELNQKIQLLNSENRINFWKVDYETYDLDTWLIVDKKWNIEKSILEGFRVKIINIIDWKTNIENIKQKTRITPIYLPSHYSNIRIHWINFINKESFVDFIKIEFSMPKFKYGSNCWLLYEWKQALEDLRKTFDEIGIKLDYVDNWEIKRMDICYSYKLLDKDLEPDENAVSNLIESYSTKEVARMIKKTYPWTVQWHTKEWKTFKIYDKCKEANARIDNKPSHFEKLIKYFNEWKINIVWLIYSLYSHKWILRVELELRKTKIIREMLEKVTKQKYETYDKIRGLAEKRPIYIKDINNDILEKLLQFETKRIMKQQTTSTIKATTRNGLVLELEKLVEENKITKRRKTALVNTCFMYIDSEFKYISKSTKYDFLNRLKEIWIDISLLDNIRANEKKKKTLKTKDLDTFTLKIPSQKYASNIDDKTPLSYLDKDNNNLINILKEQFTNAENFNLMFLNVLFRTMPEIHDIIEELELCEWFMQDDKNCNYLWDLSQQIKLWEESKELKKFQEKIFEKIGLTEKNLWKLDNPIEAINNIKLFLDLKATKKHQYDFQKTLPTRENEENEDFSI